MRRDAVARPGPAQRARRLAGCRAVGGASAERGFRRLDQRAEERAVHAVLPACGARASQIPSARRSGPCAPRRAAVVFPGATVVCGRAAVQDIHLLVARGAAAADLVARGPARLARPARDRPIRRARGGTGGRDLPGRNARPADGAHCAPARAGAAATRPAGEPSTVLLCRQGFLAHAPDGRLPALDHRSARRVVVHLPRGRAPGARQFVGRSPADRPRAVGRGALFRR